jgi:hypothetical protein
MQAGTDPINRAALETPLPCRARAMLESIDASRMTTCQSLHQQSNACSAITRIDDQMHMIRHQAVAVDLQTEFAAKLAQRLEVRKAIAIGNEDDATIVSTLNDVVGIVRNNYASATRHPCLRCSLAPL